MIDMELVTSRLRVVERALVICDEEGSVSNDRILANYANRNRVVHSCAPKVEHLYRVLDSLEP